MVSTWYKPSWGFALRFSKLFRSLPILLNEVSPMVDSFPKVLHFFNIFIWMNLYIYLNIFFLNRIVKGNNAYFIYSIYLETFPACFLSKIAFYVPLFIRYIFHVCIIQFLLPISIVLTYVAILSARLVLAKFWNPRNEIPTYGPALEQLSFWAWIKF